MGHVLLDCRAPKSFAPANSLFWSRPVGRNHSLTCKSSVLHEHYVRSLGRHQDQPLFRNGMDAHASPQAAPLTTIANVSTTHSLLAAGTAVSPVSRSSQGSHAAALIRGLRRCGPLADVLALWESTSKVHGLASPFSFRHCTEKVCTSIAQSSRTGANPPAIAEPSVSVWAQVSASVSVFASSRRP